MGQTGMTTRRLLLIILDANTTHEAVTCYARQCTRTNFPSNKKQLLNPGGFKNYSTTLTYIWLSLYILAVLAVAQLG